jgi:hypothetical protein
MLNCYTFIKNLALGLPMKSRLFYPITIAEEIEKAKRYIATNQFKAGFREIVNPGLGGLLEVKIEADEKQPDNFLVSMKYVSLPDRKPIISEERSISYSELRRMATAYDQDKTAIDEELASREALSSPKMR